MLEEAAKYEELARRANNGASDPRGGIPSLSSGSWQRAARSGGDSGSERQGGAQPGQRLGHAAAFLSGKVGEAFHLHTIQLSGYGPRGRSLQHRNSGIEARIKEVVGKSKPRKHKSWPSWWCRGSSVMAGFAYMPSMRQGGKRAASSRWSRSIQANASMGPLGGWSGWCAGYTRPLTTWGLPVHGLRTPAPDLHASPSSAC